MCSSDLEGGIIERFSGGYQACFGPCFSSPSILFQLFDGSGNTACFQRLGGLPPAVKVLEAFRILERFSTECHYPQGAIP